MMDVFGLFRGQRKRRGRQAYWRNVAETTIRLRKKVGQETLREGALDALTIAGISADERGLSLEGIIEHIEATYHDYTIDITADGSPCDPWPCSLILARAA